VIEAGDMKHNEEKDWYYNVEKENEKPVRCGPITFSEVSIFIGVTCVLVTN
jgi:DnaJ homolog subfamily C member 13